MNYKLVCIHCHENFLVAYACKQGQKFCSTSCKKHCQIGRKQERVKPRLTRICVVCGEIFFVKPSDKETKKYCSFVCRSGDPNWRQKMSESKKGQRPSEATRLKIKRTMIQMYSDPRIRHRLHLGKSQQPNKIEQAFLEFLEEKFPGQYRYVGDGSLIVGRFSPDFTHVSEKRLIEIYGDYWHAGDDPQERIAYFAEFGYQTQVLWEHEVRQILKDGKFWTQKYV